MPNQAEKNLYRQFERWLDTLEYCRYKKLKGGLTQRNEPDYIVIIRNRAILLEFKKSGADIRESQTKRLNWWAKACRAAWCDNLEAAKRIVLEEERIAIKLYEIEQAMYE